MTTAVLEREIPQADLRTADHEFLTFYVGKQLFGVPVLSVRDVLKPQSLARIPLAPKEVAGVINLRRAGAHVDLLGFCICRLNETREARILSGNPAAHFGLARSC